MIHFQIKMLENGKKSIFTDIQNTNRVALIILDVKMLPER